MANETLRDRARRSMQAELADAAQDLFLEHGYDATTIDHIAAAVGISRRSFFRYFSGKEELVVGKYELWVDDMVEALRARPDDEAPWTALRRTLDRIVDYYADPARRDRVVALQAIVDGSPALRGASLEVFDRLQRRLADILVERSAVPPGVAFALAGAAWASLQAALADALASDPTTFPERLDTIMAAVRGHDTPARAQMSGHDT